jgi:hypothetical protein
LGGPGVFPKMTHNLLMDMPMKTRIPLLLLVHLLFIMASCQKDPLTQPVKVNFQFGMSPFEMEEAHTGPVALEETDNPPFGVPGGAQNGNGPLVIDNGTLVISAIDFEGRREQGEDVFFTYTPPQPVVADLADETTSLPISFDIPQGVYTRIEVILHLGTEELTPLVLTGIINRGPFQSLPVRFDYKFTEEIRMRGKGVNQANMVLSEDHPSLARVELDAAAVFRLVNMGMVMNASVISENGQDIVVIDNTNNLPIFNMIANRLGNAFSLVID